MSRLRMTLAATVICLTIALSEWCVCKIPLHNTIGGREVRKALWKGREIEYVDRTVSVKLSQAKGSDLIAAFLKRSKATVIRGFDDRGWGLVDFPSGVDILAAIGELEKEEGVEIAEPQFAGRACWTPNDQYYQLGKQWSLHNVGQSPPSGNAGADISAPRAWGITGGSADVLVAVLDTGIPLFEGELCHPDLCNDSKFLLGADFTGDGSGVKDLCGHGTMMTGILAAETNNGIGIAGVAAGCRVLTVQVFDEYGGWWDWWASSGIIYAVDNGAKVINFSGGYNGPSALLEAAVAYAESHNVLMVASVGNTSMEGVRWPAAYSSTHTNVVAVSGTNQYDDRYGWSTYGPEVTMSAPAGYGGFFDSNDVVSTTPNYYFTYEDEGITEVYGYGHGTSISAAHVSGVAALILSVSPGLLPSTIRGILQSSADDLGLPGLPGWDRFFGSGRVNAYRALKFTLEHYGGTVARTLDIPSGEQWTFSPNCRLLIEGALSASNVTFTSSSSPWFGIEFFGTGNGNVLTGCTIENAQFGVFAHATNGLQISHCTIQNNSTGVYSGVVPLLVDFL
jgi:subtilisin family serine protease